MSQSIELVFILLAMSVGVTALAKKFQKPYPIALVIIGAIIGLMPLHGMFEELKEFFASDEIFRTAIIAIFLPTLLGEASLKLAFEHLKENKLSIIGLAFVGTMLAFLITGGLTHTLFSIPWQTALVFGALMSATDPVSVISIFKSLGVNRRLAIIMEGESLINDGVAVVLFTLSAFSFTAISSMGAWGVAVGLGTFLKVSLGGLIIGLVLGFLFSQIVAFFDDYPLENAISVVLFYGAYFIAEYFHVSGVIAVVTAGLVLGNYGKIIGMSPTTRLSISVFWDTLTLVANSLVFILVGLEIARINMLTHLVAIGGVIIVVLIGRSCAVYISTIGFELPWSWKHVLNWGGLKGSLSLALALSLPPHFPGRELLIALTFGVVFFSLIVQGLTVGPLVRFLGLQKTVQGLREYELLTFELQQALAAMDELNRLKQQGRVSPLIFEKLEKEKTERTALVIKELGRLYEQQPELLQEQEYYVRKKLLYAEHQAIERLLGEGVLSQETGEKRKHSVLERLETLRNNKE